jgi:hypothetical protein
MSTPTERSESVWNRIAPELERLTTFEEKKNYLDAHKYLPQVMEVLPEFKEKVNSYMIQDIVTEFGNPDAPGFTFSKKYSDQFLFDKLNLMEKNATVYEDYFGGEEGILRLEERMEQRNADYTEASGKVTNLREAILQRRREFDARSQPFGGPAGVFTVPMQFMKPVMQATGGWIDWFKSEGLEKVENRKLDWDPLNKRYGPGPEIPALQKELAKAYEEKTDTVPQQYFEESQKYKEYQDMMSGDEYNKAIVNSTGLDEALNYLDIESLKSLLQGS